MPGTKPSARIGAKPGSPGDSDFTVARTLLGRDRRFAPGTDHTIDDPVGGRIGDAEVQAGDDDEAQHDRGGLPDLAAVGPLDPLQLGPGGREERDEAKAARLGGRGGAGACVRRRRDGVRVGQLGRGPDGPEGRIPELPLPGRPRTDIGVWRAVVPVRGGDPVVDLIDVDGEVDSDIVPIGVGVCGKIGEREPWLAGFVLAGFDAWRGEADWAVEATFSCSLFSSVFSTSPVSCGAAGVAGSTGEGSAAGSGVVSATASGAVSGCGSGASTGSGATMSAGFGCGLGSITGSGSTDGSSTGGAGGVPAARRRGTGSMTRRSSCCESCSRKTTASLSPSL